jgi:hypothetical protein
VAEAAIVCATGIVIYLSLNAVMHPWSLPVHLTHLWPWPNEGTTRVIGLAVGLAGVATRHYLRATATRPADTAPADTAPAAQSAQDTANAENAPSRTKPDRVPETGQDLVAVPPD